MKRGFPRPQMHVSRCQTNITKDESGRIIYGGYGEFWDDKTYPVPYTAEEDSISTLHSGRLKDCVLFNNCIACGDPVTEEIVSVMYQDNKIFSESGPFHEKCARLTERMCPHIAVSDRYGFKQMRWSEVKSQVVAFVS